MKISVSFWPIAPPSGFVLLLSLLSSLVALTKGELTITEISSTGTAGACQGRDWVEIYNNGTTSVDLFDGGYMLHDDNGMLHPDAFQLLLLVPPGSHLLLFQIWTLWS